MTSTTPDTAELTAMQPRSLGYRTDLRVLELSGSVIENRGTHLVVRTPDNPTFHWGNFILLAQPPVPGGEREVVGAFHTEFPDAQHISIGIDGTADADLPESSRAAFEACGLELDNGTVLTASELRLPRPVEAEIRPLVTDEEWHARARLSVAANETEAEFYHLEFARSRNDAERRLVEHGVLQRYAAFVDGEPVSTAAIVLTHAGWARFQSVETHPDHRRQGLAGAVVHAASRHAIDAWGTVKQVIVADTAGDAIRLYRSLGFTDAEQQIALGSRPGPAAGVTPRPR